MHYIVHYSDVKLDLRLALSSLSMDLSLLGTQILSHTLTPTTADLLMLPNTNFPSHHDFPEACGE